MYDTPYESTHIVIGKKRSKSKIHILPIYGQTDSKPAIVITPHFQSIHRHFEGRHSEVAEKEAKPVPSKDLTPPDFQVIRLPTEGRHSEVAEKEVKPVPSKDLAPLDVQSFRRPFEGKHSEVAEKEAKPVPSKDLTPPDVQAFFLSCEGAVTSSGILKAKQKLGITFNSD